MKSSIAPIALAILLLGPGCASIARDTQDYEMNKWKGRDISRLSKKWGPPTRVTSDRRGGKVYFYDLSGYEGETTGVAGDMDAYGQVEKVPDWLIEHRKKSPTNIGIVRGPSYPRGRWIERYRRFYVDSTGKITDATWEGGTFVGYEGFLWGKKHFHSNLRTTITP